MKNLISVFLFLSIFLFSGCIHFYDYKQYQMRIIDPELNQPVENASISVRYCFPGRIWRQMPKSVKEKTDASGLAKVKVATNSRPYAPICSIRADGYMHTAPSDIRMGIDTRWVPSNTRVGNEGEVIIPIYKKPEPTIEIVVPDDYLGPVVIHLIQANEWIQGKPGQREFSYKVGQNGYLSIEASPLLSLPVLYLAHPDSNNSVITVRRENGQEILFAGREHELKPDSIGFRWVHAEGPKILYIIGKAQDRQALYAKVRPGGRGPIGKDVFNSYFQD